MPRKQQNLMCKGDEMNLMQGLAALRPYLDEAIPKLFRILSDEAAEVSGNAAGALVNLSGDPPGVAALLKAGVCNRVMTHVRELTCPHHDLLMMLLSNVTLDEVCMLFRPRAASGQAHPCQGSSSTFSRVALWFT